MVCLPFRRLFLFAGLLLFASGSRAAAEEELPDSLLTEDYLYEYTFTDFGKAGALSNGCASGKYSNPTGWILPKATSISIRGATTRGSVITGVRSKAMWCGKAMRNTWTSCTG